MVIGILIMLALALAFILFFNFSQKRILKEQMRQQRMAYEHQEALLHSTILTQEEERKRIAQDLHDEIGSKLNVILLNAHQLKKLEKGNLAMTSITNELSSLVNTTIETTRRISHDLLPPTLEEFGLVEAIKELKDAYRHSDTISFDFQFTENIEKIKNKIIELNLYRVLQELINNSIRHGAATQLTIDLEMVGNSIKIKYQDNGRGFDSINFQNKKGLGIKNMESRLRMIQATHQMNSAPGQGLTMMIELENKLKIKTK